MDIKLPNLSTLQTGHLQSLVSLEEIESFLDKIHLGLKKSNEVKITPEDIRKESTRVALGEKFIALTKLDSIDEENRQTVHASWLSSINKAGQNKLDFLEERKQEKDQLAVRREANNRYDAEIQIADEIKAIKESELEKIYTQSKEEIENRYKLDNQETGNLSDILGKVFET